MTTYDGDVDVVSVVKGEPTDEELVALFVVLHSCAGARPAQTAASARPRGWRDRTRLMRRYTTAGAGAWRATARADR